jgi:hypothetical protein
MWWRSWIMFMDDTMSIFLWKRHKLVSILIVCLLQQKGLCDKLLSNNVKFKLQSNIQLWDVYFMLKIYSFVIRKEELNFVCTFNFMHLKLIVEYKWKTLQKFGWKKLKFSLWNMIKLNLEKLLYRWRP